MTLTSTRRRLGQITISVVAGAGLLLGTATAAQADNGDRTSTVSCGSYQSPVSGTAHARIRNCSVTFGKNIYDGTYWQTANFQLLDALTDGYCARSFSSGGNQGVQINHSECNGVWTSKSATFYGRSSSVFILLNYGTSSQVFGTWGGTSGVNAPVGY